MESGQPMLYLTVYKVATLVIGLAFAFMGYRLFLRGIITEAGEVQTNWENRSLVLKKAAPGTFFALFGTAIVCVSLWRGYFFSDGKERAVGVPVDDARVVVSGALGGGDGDAARRKAERGQVERTLADLKEVMTLLPSNINPSVRGRVERTVRDGRIALIYSVWGSDWGDFQEFRSWAQLAESDGRDVPVGVPWTQAAAMFKRRNPS